MTKKKGLNPILRTLLKLAPSFVATWWLNSIDDKRRKGIAESHKLGDASIAINAYVTTGNKYQDVLDAYYRIRTRKLRHLALKWCLEVPKKPNEEESDEFWKWSPTEGHVLLPKGQNFVRGQFSQYQANRIAIWSGLSGALLGAISIAMQLLTILSSPHTP